MKIEKNLSYKKHVLVCVNESGQFESNCKEVKGLEIFNLLKDFVIKNNLASEIWITKTGCLGFCNDVGCTVVVYPDKVWFLQTTEDDLEEIKNYLVKDLK